ncbi:MAG: hypothetical protein M3Y82_14820, partial [Verrucomicrobiota bacterium]|nr:hypothetical protein [Verrucomicrobiota bacterium]
RASTAKAPSCLLSRGELIYEFCSFYLLKNSVGSFLRLAQLPLNNHCAAMSRIKANEFSE